MATTINHIPRQPITYEKCEVKSVKELAESSNLTTIPSCYAYFADPAKAATSDSDFHDYSVPVIDFSLLQSCSPAQRSQTIQLLANACQQWGFFMVVNHGVPESLTNAMIDKCDEFFNLTAEEKREFEGKHTWDPIKCGTSFNTSVEEVHFWRDYLKVMVHPQFHSPSKPLGFSEVSSEYCKQIRRVARELLRGISTSLGLEELEIERSMDLESGLQMLVANYYPPCPQSDHAIGLPPHSDYGLLTLLVDNQVRGLQVQHHGRWVPINPLPNSIIANVADHLEILSNGKYKSVMHRATVNNTATRISVGIATCPPLDALVTPAPPLIRSALPIYKPMLFSQYVHLQQSKRLDGKSCLDYVRV